MRRCVRILLLSLSGTFLLLPALRADTDHHAVYRWLVNTGDDSVAWDRVQYTIYRNDNGRLGERYEGSVNLPSKGANPWDRSRNETVYLYISDPLQGTPTITDALFLIEMYNGGDLVATATIQSDFYSAYEVYFLNSDRPATKNGWGTLTPIGNDSAMFVVPVAPTPEPSSGLLLLVGGALLALRRKVA